MQVRENALKLWLNSVLNKNSYAIKPLAGDASFRRYFRVHHQGKNYVVMDAPPEKEAITSFISVNNTLANHGVHVPQIYAVDLALGFILLEDLGDQLLLGILTIDNVDKLYKAAMASLLNIQQCSTTTPPLPVFDQTHMLSEMSLFRDWFLQQYLTLHLSHDEELLLEQTYHWLANEISHQPYVFIHRDYHSRNLILVEGAKSHSDQHDKITMYKPYIQEKQNEGDASANYNAIDIGVIDFQDAMHGPFTYDLVSLLKDCYIQWPREQILEWVNYFHAALPNKSELDLANFIYAFDLCGLQRHLKVLGIFCRLHLRDHKTAYLRDLPLTFHYTMACLETYPQLHAFYKFMKQRVEQPFLVKSRT